MGSKKKSRGKQRKNLKAKSHESHGGLGCFEGEEEGLKRLLEDIHETKEIDCHMVAKCLPKTLRNMREKKIEVHSLSIQLVCEYKNAYILPNITSSELEDKTNDHLCQSLAEKAFEFVPGYRELLSKDDIQQFSKYLLFLLSNEAVCEHLAKAGGNPYFDGSDSDNKADDDLAFLTNPIRTVLSSRAIDWQNFEMDKLKTAVDATCRSWAPRMDNKLCNGETGAFLRQCPIYERGTPELRDVKYSILEETELGKALISFETICKAATNCGREFRIGVYDVKRSCWECGKVPGDQTGIFACGGCDVACYCGKSCQERAWEGGHKNACKSLNTKYKTLQKAIRTVDDEHNSTSAPSLYDYVVVARLVAKIEEQSMEHFYNNLDRVRNGEWWLFDDDAIGTIDEYLRKLGSSKMPECLAKIEHAGFLLLDWESMDRTTYESTRRWVQENLGCVPMSSERFLFLYQTQCNDGRRFQGPRWNRTRRSLIKNALATFRARYHKSDCATNPKLD